MVGRKLSKLTSTVSAERCVLLFRQPSLHLLHLLQTCCLKKVNGGLIMCDGGKYIHLAFFIGQKVKSILHAERWVRPCMYSLQLKCRQRVSKEKQKKLIVWMDILNSYVLVLITVITDCTVHLILWLSHIWLLSFPTSMRIMPYLHYE